MGMEKPFAQFPASIGGYIALMSAFLIIRGKFSDKFNWMLKGIAKPSIAVPLVVFALAGAFATVAKACGGVDSIVGLCMNYVPTSVITAGFFVVGCIVSFASGSSISTIVALAPIALSIAVGAGISVPIMAASVMGSAMFGNSMSLISDCTIVSNSVMGIGAGKATKDKLISQAVLKLVPPPQASKALMAVFDDMQKAAEAVAGIIAAHVVPCTLEFLDNNTIVRVDDYTKAGLPRDAAAILLIEVDGHPAQVADEAVVVERVLQQTGAVAVHVAKDAAEKFKLWEARRQALPVLARCKPTTVLEDATVPRSQIPAMMKAVNDIAKKYNVEVGTFGHAGDGNLHPTFLCDKRDKEEFARVEAAVDEMFDVAISLHGTLSGEHGIGTAKSKWMEKETSRGTILFSQRLRRALDPKGLLNPTKLVGI